MNGARSFPDPAPGWQPPETLVQASAPFDELLSGFIHGCAQDPATQTMATTALVLALWQLQGGALSAHVPSAILLHAGETGPDPVDGFVRTLVHDEEACQPGNVTRSPGVVITPEEAPLYMEQAVRERREIDDHFDAHPFARRNAATCEAFYRDAMKAAHGSGWARPYAKAWHEQFGLLTDETDGLIVRLEEDDDRAAFLHHVLKDQVKLLDPFGIGQGLQLTPKSICVSGSLTPDQWDGKLVLGIIELGLPILFLPHAGRESLVVDNTPAFRVLPGLWRDAMDGRARVTLAVTPNEWFAIHERDFRRRLHLLPGGGAYEFAVLQVLHQLDSVCQRISLFAARNGKPTAELFSALFWDLKTRAFRAITLGVAALAWHVLGFDPGCPRKQAIKALEDLRTKGPMSRSQVLVGARLNKVRRDLLLERLAAEDLVRVEGKIVTATTFTEFVEALHSRPGLPGAVNFAALVRKEGTASA